MLPGAHGVGSKLPVVQAWPAGQAVHSLGAVRSVALEYDPSSQGSGAATALAQ